VVPLTFAAAKAFVIEHHRHHSAPVGHKFSIGVVDDTGALRGVAIIGRPVARHYDDGTTAELTRSATDGCPNANSALYAAAWRTAKGMGYTRLITYTQEGESGASLRGAGWTVIAQRKPRKGWDTPSRPRSGNGNDGIERTLWEAS
jgi:hypothetical protein